MNWECFFMTNTAFDWQIDEFMVNCRSRQLRERTMGSYEQTLRLFERWCREQMNLDDVDKITESVKLFMALGAFFPVLHFKDSTIPFMPTIPTFPEHLFPTSIYNIARLQSPIFTVVPLLCDLWIDRL